MASSPGADQDRLSILLQLEAMARNAESEKALQFLIVNETRRLVSYRQAFLLSSLKDRNNHCRVEAASSISVIDKNSPLVRWLERIVKILFDQNEVKSIQQLDVERCPEQEQSGWSEYSLPYVVWVPLNLPDESFLGGIWLAKETEWEDAELTLLQRLADTYAHAWDALVGRKKITSGLNRNKIIFWSVIASLILISCIPVKLSTIAPVEVVAKEPAIVSAPIDGVINDIPIQPNTLVQEGEVVFQYEDTNLRNSYEIALKAHEVALAKLKKATQGAFQDAKIKAQISLLKAEVELKETELNFAKELLEQVTVRAAKDGLLIYTEKSDWIGRPVSVGERVMEIANPGNVKLKIDLPVDDAIVLEEGASVEVFLDVDPLDSVSAEITHTSFNAYLTPSDVLAYKLDAAFLEEDTDVRIGLQGSAKIYGEKVSLFFYLFRRPISALRQFIGL